MNTKPAPNKPWTDEEIGYIQATLDLPRIAVAKSIGRTVQSISSMRRRLRQDTPPRTTLWDAEEELIIRSTNHMVVSSVATLLPGRTIRAIHHKRNSMGISAIRAESKPTNPGPRTVIAKTCSKCGHLLPGAWFYTFRDNGNLRTGTYCKKCNSLDFSGTRKQPPRDDEKDRARFLHLQKITLRTATRNRDEYTEADFRVLADDTKTLLAKALELHRTYAAVMNATKKNGFRAAALGDPYAERWIIDNPSAPEAVAITAAFKAAIDNGIIPAPEWDWDDHDLKETA